MTGDVLDKAGIPGQPSRLKLHPLFTRLSENLDRDGRPIPQARAIDAPGRRGGKESSSRGQGTAGGSGIRSWTRHRHPQPPPESSARSAVAAGKPGGSQLPRRFPVRHLLLARYRSRCLAVGRSTQLKFVADLHGAAGCQVSLEMFYPTLDKLTGWERGWANLNAVG